tara:strand:- start:1485 stop:3476 length:1992 start_codon:yes stop_codon:yes gene_type:complete
LKISNPSFIKSVSFLSFDLYQKVFPLRKQNSEVIIVDIDEKSLSKFGQFPWNRSVFAKILGNINEANPKVIGFDVFFSEKDKQTPEEFIKAYDLKSKELIDKLKNIESHDEYFTKELANSESVFAVLGSTEKLYKKYNRKPKARFLFKGGDPNQFIYKYPNSIGSLELLENNVKGLGSISFLDQTDGIIRSLPLIISFDKKIYPTMGLEMIRVGSKQKNLFVNLDEVGIQKISVRPNKILTDNNGLFWIRYKLPQQSQYISASSVFEGNFDRSRFENKYVLIGTSAQGLFDIVKTPLGIIMPGVEVHANVIENILDKSYLLRNPKVYLLELLITIILATVVFVLSQKIKPKYSLPVFILAFFSIIITGFAFYNFRGELIDISYPSFILLVTFLTGLYFRFIQENKFALENLKKETKLLRERELAGDVQKSLFPEILKYQNFICAKNIPARDVSGDYYDLINVSKNEYYFSLADVSGKGVKAGMYMAKASSTFRALSKLSMPLEKVVFLVNNELVESKFKGMFVTAVFGKFNTETGDVTFVNAGHESIMLFDKRLKFEFLKSDLPPIGIVKYFTESIVVSKTINLKDKTFVVYTDGVTEGYLENGKELGADGVEEIIKNLKDVNPLSIVNGIASKLDWGSDKLRDDITCLVINLENTELLKKKK